VVTIYLQVALSSGRRRRQSTSLFRQCYAMCKIEFKDLDFQKMKGSNGIELLKFS